MRSIRARVSVWTAVGVVIVLAGASVIWYRNTEHALVGQFDRALVARLTALATLVEPADEGASPFEFDVVPELAVEYRRGPHAAYFELRQPTGEVIARSESLHDSELHVPGTGTIEAPHVADLVLPDGRPGRAVAAAWTVRPRPDDAEHAEQVARLGEGLPVELVVAVDRTDLDGALGTLLLGIAALAVAMAVAAAGIVALVVARGLAPLRALGREVAALDPRALPPALHVQEVPRELRAIVDRTDELLGRVRDALDRERRTSTAIAHELRTPIAELRSLTDVALKWPDDDEYGRRALAEANGIALQMENLADAVLRLSRAENGEMEPRAESFDLREDVGGVLEAYRHRATERGLDLRFDANGRVDVVTDRGMARVVLANLVANAVEHSPEGTAVRCAIDGDDGRVRVTVRNHKGDLEAGDVSRLTERFWQKDGARSRRDHAGIGLALAHELCDRLGAGLAFALDESDLVASVTLPLAHD